MLSCTGEGRRMGLEVTYLKLSKFPVFFFFFLVSFCFIMITLSKGHVVLRWFSIAYQDHCDTAPDFDFHWSHKKKKKHFFSYILFSLDTNKPADQGNFFEVSVIASQGMPADGCGLGSRGRKRFGKTCKSEIIISTFFVLCWSSAVQLNVTTIVLFLLLWFSGPCT